MSLRKLALGWPLAASLLLLSLVLAVRAAVQELPYDVPNFTGKTYDVVLQMATDPHTHRQVFTHIDTPPSAGATVLHQAPTPGTKIPYGTKNAVLRLSWQPAQQKPSNPNLLTQLISPFAAAEQSTVPQLKGVSQTEASRRLELAKLRANFSDGPDGVVIGVNPGELAKVPRNSVVNVTMGTHVPPLAGQTADAAQQILRNSRLALGRVYTPNGKGGTISGSDPPADTGVLFNSLVNVTLAGNPSAQQPTGNTTGNTTGNDVSQGVPPGTQGVQPPTNGVVPPTQGVQPPTNGVLPPTNGVQPPTNGVVPPTNGVVPPANGILPPANGVVPPTGGVVPLPPPLATIPDVVSLEQKNANSMLDGAGFRLLRAHGNVNGVVISQNPPGYSEADPKLPVDLYFDLPQVTVPDVRDDQESPAIVRLAVEGLGTAIGRRTSWLPDSMETVISQDPLPGTMVAPRSSVQIVLGVYGIPSNSVLIGLVALAMAAVGGAGFLGVKIIRGLFRPPPPRPIPPKPPVPQPPPPPQQHVNPHPEAHCDFVPQAGPHHVYIRTSGPAIHVSFTLRRQGGTPKYRIATQPSVRRVR